MAKDIKAQEVLRRVLKGERMMDEDNVFEGILNQDNLIDASRNFIESIQSKAEKIRCTEDFDMGREVTLLIPAFEKFDNFFSDYDFVSNTPYENLVVRNRLEMLDNRLTEVNEASYFDLYDYARLFVVDEVIDIDMVDIKEGLKESNFPAKLNDPDANALVSSLENMLLHIKNSENPYIAENYEKIAPMLFELDQNIARHQFGFDWADEDVHIKNRAATIKSNMSHIIDSYYGIDETANALLKDISTCNKDVLYAILKDISTCNKDVLYAISPRVSINMGTQKELRNIKGMLINLRRVASKNRNEFVSSPDDFLNLEGMLANGKTFFEKTYENCDRLGGDMKYEDKKELQCSLENTIHNVFENVKNLSTEIEASIQNEAYSAVDKKIEDISNMLALGIDALENARERTRQTSPLYHIEKIEGEVWNCNSRANEVKQDDKKSKMKAIKKAIKKANTKSRYADNGLGF